MDKLDFVKLMSFYISDSLNLDMEVISDRLDIIMDSYKKIPLSLFRTIINIIKTYSHKTKTEKDRVILLEVIYDFLNQCVGYTSDAINNKLVSYTISKKPHPGYLYTMETYNKIMYLKKL